MPLIFQNIVLLSFKICYLYLCTGKDEKQKLPLNIKDSFMNFKLTKQPKIISCKLSQKTINQTKSKDALKLKYISSLMYCISEIFSIDSFFKTSRSFCNVQ